MEYPGGSDHQYAAALLVQLGATCEPVHIGPWFRQDDDVKAAIRDELTRLGIDNLESRDRAIVKLWINKAWPLIAARVRAEAAEGECEREDCQRIATTASEVYCDITGGALSKPGYDARTILAHANDETQKLIDSERAEAVADERQRIAAAIEAEVSSWSDIPTSGVATIPERALVIDGLTIAYRIAVAAGSVPAATPTEPMVTLTRDTLDGGWVAEFTPMPGCMSQGETIPDALRGLADALTETVAAIVDAMDSPAEQDGQR